MRKVSMRNVHYIHATLAKHLRNELCILRPPAPSQTPCTETAVAHSPRFCFVAATLPLVSPPVAVQ